MTVSKANRLAVKWPPKFNLFGIQVSAVTCDQACDAILRAAQQREPAVASAFSVHALIEAATAPRLVKKANRFAMITPDGQPVRWALNWLHGVRLERNVRGSELMWRLCQRAATEGVSIYLYGGTSETLAALQANLLKVFDTIEIAGAESPPFRQLSLEEDVEMIDRVNSSGAGLMFIGLGSPKQDYFAADHVGRIQAVQVCVGAAFDFHAGTKPTAPEWMQRRGLEWVFRLYREPGRLWKRYLITNTKFIFKLADQLVRKQFLRATTRGAMGERSRPFCREQVSPQDERPQDVMLEEKRLS